MVVLKVVEWGAFVSAAAWAYLALASHTNDDAIFGFACAAGSFALGAFFAALSRIVMLLERGDKNEATSTKGSSGGPLGMIRSIIYGLPLR